jgi:hypothetical protein
LPFIHSCSFPSVPSSSFPHLLRFACPSSCVFSV